MSDTATVAPWRTNLVLFLATAVSVFFTGVVSMGDSGGETDLLPSILRTFGDRASLARGGAFTGTILLILVAHELGHYVAARIHKVDASLPYFIPMPLLSPFGTMGAVIRMRGTIPTRRALLDIGAAGPLAGLVFALPLYAWGVAHSDVVAVSGGEGTMFFGESIAIKAIHRLVTVVPDGMDIQLSPVAMGAWGGLFVTMINLLPVGQLDGGHVAYALFGPRQDRFARVVHRSMLVFFGVIVLGHTLRDVHAGFGFYRLGQHIGNGLFWLVWFHVLAVLGTLSARATPTVRPGSSHTDRPLSIRTRLLALVGLLVVGSLARDNHQPLYLVAFFGGLGMLVAMDAKFGALRRTDLLDHPPTGNAPLDPFRKAVAILTLAMFVLLFMPEPISM